ncbi:MAG: replicative DNA helicase, partial [Stackebrandtia sp.]
TDLDQRGGIGGAPYLHTLIASVPVAANAGHYAGIVAEKAWRRRLIDAGARIVQLGHSDHDATTVNDRAGQTLLDATASRGGEDLVPIGQLTAPVIEDIEEAGRRTGIRGLATGYTDLDRLTNGMQPGQLWVVAARPGVGKSVLAADIARHAALQLRKHVYFASLEMSAKELTNRVIAAECKIPLFRIHDGKLNDEEWAKVADCAGELADAPFNIDETAHISVTEIRARARRAAQRGHLDLVIVDYLQLIASTTGRRNDTREREVADISRGLKVLAKDLAVPVIAIAQLNRAVEGRVDKRPALADLRESGAVEQDSDVVILLHRPDYYDKESGRAGEIDLHVAKNRHGPTDVVTLAAQLHYSRLMDMSRQHLRSA